MGKETFGHDKQLLSQIELGAVALLQGAGPDLALPREATES